MLAHHTKINAGKKSQSLNHQSTAAPFNLEVDGIEFISITSAPITNLGTFTINITIDPNNQINELYSLKNGSLRVNWQFDNSRNAELTIITLGTSDGDGGSQPSVDNTPIIIGATIIAIGLTLFGLFIGLGLYLGKKPEKMTKMSRKLRTKE